MKEASGELSMTVIVIIGAIGLAGIVTWLVPEIKDMIMEKWDQAIECEDSNHDGVCDK